MSLLHSNIDLGVYVVTNGIVLFLELYIINGTFNFRYEMVPPPNHYDYHKYLCRYEHIDKLIANRLRNGMKQKDNNDITFK